MTRKLKKYLIRKDSIGATCKVRGRQRLAFLGREEVKETCRRQIARNAWRTDLPVNSLIKHGTQTVLCEARSFRKYKSSCECPIKKVRLYFLDYKETLKGLRFFVALSEIRCCCC